MWFVKHRKSCFSRTCRSILPALCNERQECCSTACEKGSKVLNYQMILLVSHFLNQMQHVFPEIWNLEKRFGSIISGAIQSKLSAKKDTTGGINSSTQKKQKHGSFSFLGGMQGFI